MKYQGLDLETLEFIKTMFGYYSDHSTRCQGYTHLKDLIDRAKKFIPNEPKTVSNNEQKRKICNDSSEDGCQLKYTECKDCKYFY